jgi:PRC-barrel domain
MVSRFSLHESAGGKYLLGLNGERETADQELSMATLNDPLNPSDRLTTASTMRGSTVFNIALEELGRIEDVIIEEPAGHIAFAILHTGGFLGIGARHYPLR